jgi:MIF4G domain
LLKLQEDTSIQAKNSEYKDAGENDLDEDDHEALGNMFSTIGKTIDTNHARTFMTVCFAKMAKFSEEKSSSSRVQFMYKDLIELRASEWVPHRKEEKAKTLDEIRQDVEREVRMQEQQRASFNSGGRGNGGGGGSSMSGRGNNTLGCGAGDSRQSSYDSASRRVSKQAQTNEDGFTTIAPVRSTSTRGIFRRPADKPTSDQQPVDGSVFGPKASKMAATSVFARTSQAQAASEQVTTSKPADMPLTQDQLEHRIAFILSEYMADPTNINELMLSVDELAATLGWSLTFLQKNVDCMFNCKSDEREAIISLFALLLEKEKSKTRTLEMYNKM